MTRKKQLHFRSSIYSENLSTHQQLYNDMKVGAKKMKWNISEISSVVDKCQRGVNVMQISFYKKLSREEMNKMSKMWDEIKIRKFSC